MSTAVEKLAYTVAEAAEALGVSEDTVRREIDEGKLRASKIRGRVVVWRVAIEQHLAANEVRTCDAEAASGTSTSTARIESLSRPPTKRRRALASTNTSPAPDVRQLLGVRKRRSSP